jgi:hypothetical protein
LLTVFTLIQQYSTQLNTIPKTMDNTTALSLQKKALKILLLFILGSFALALLIIVFTLIILIIYCIETVMASVLSAFVPLLSMFLRTMWEATIPLLLAITMCGLMLYGCWYFRLLA